MKVDIIPSGAKVKIALPTELEGPNYVLSHYNLVADAREQMANIKHFSNCLFSVKDLQELVTPSEGAVKSSHIIFSHVCCTDVDGKIFSTALAIGFLQEERRIRWDDAKIFISADVDIELCNSGMYDFRPIEHLHWQEDASVERIWKSDFKESFSSWCEQFDPRQTVIDGLPPKALMKGVYYEVNDLQDLGYLDNEQQEKIALLPITLKTYQDDPTHPALLPTVSYVLAPVYGTETLGYPPKRKFAVSEKTWPRNWTDTD